MRQGVTQSGASSRPIIRRYAINLFFTMTPHPMEEQGRRGHPTVAHVYVHQVFHTSFEEMARCERAHRLCCTNSQGITSPFKFLCLQKVFFLSFKLISEAQRTEALVSLIMGPLSPSSTLSPKSVSSENGFVHEPCSRKLSPAWKGSCMAE